MKNILVSLLVLFSTILSAAPQSKSGQVGFYQATGVAGTNRFLWDRTNDWLLLTHGALVFGTNQPLVATEIIRAVADTTAGDPSARTVTIEANNSGAGTYGGALLNVNTAGDASWTLYNHLGSGFGLEFNINAPDGVTPFALDATVAHTSGSLFSVSNLNVGKFDVAHDGMIWSATNKFAFATTTNVWPLTNAVAGQVLTSAGGASAQLYWSTASGGSGPSFADLVWTNTGTAIQPTGIGANTNAINIQPNGSVRIGRANIFGDTTSGIGFNGNSNDPVSATLGVDVQTNTLQRATASLAGNVSGNSSYSETFQDATVDDYTTYLSYRVYTDALNNQLIVEAKSLSGAVVMRIEPTVADGATAIAYDYDTANALVTPGSLLARIRNNGVDHFYFNPTNGFSTPAITAYGAVSMPWQFGAASNTVNVQLEATNAVEITVAGVAYLIPAKLK